MSAAHPARRDEVLNELTGEVFDLADLGQALALRLQMQEVAAHASRLRGLADVAIRDELAKQGRDELAVGGLVAVLKTGTPTIDAEAIYDEFKALGMDGDRLRELFTVAKRKGSSGDWTKLENRYPDYAAVIDRHRTRGTGSVWVKGRPPEVSPPPSPAAELES